MKPDKEVIVRTFVLAVAWINMILSSKGWSPIPFTESEIGEAVGLVLAFVATIWSWWKNNSLTREARMGDNYMRAAKAKRAQEAE